MKRISLVLFIAAILSAAVIAEGAQEAPSRFEPAETTTLTGSISISSFPPVLTVDGEKYYVMVPPGAAENIEVTDGQEITLEGFVRPARGRFAEAGSNIIAVKRAVIDGTEYVLVRPGTRGHSSSGPRRDGEARRGGQGYSDDEPDYPGRRW